MVSANAEHKSAGQAKKMLWKLAEVPVSVPEILELSAMIGEELGAELAQQAQRHVEGKLERAYAEPPGLVAVAVDGGRIMTRAEGERGVHDPAWKETKNACLMTMSSSVSEEDPHPELPACFCERDSVEKLVREIHCLRSGGAEERRELLAISGESRGRSRSSRKRLGVEVGACQPKDAWRPQRMVRTCVSSMVSSEAFGPLVAGEAHRRGFYDASRRAFLGDGQAWNWRLQERYFGDFVGILDFVHVLPYLYEAAKVVGGEESWSVYLRASRACWPGRVGEVLEELVLGKRGTR